VGTAARPESGGGPAGGVVADGLGAATDGDATAACEPVESEAAAPVPVDAKGAV
jgi:hypothetical protein